MSRSAAHDAMYASAKAILWVEDLQTQRYLTRVWNQPEDVQTYVAGNNEAVKAIVISAGRSYPHVFGLVDRDFGNSNKADWPTKRVFRLPRHEIENYLLDPIDLYNCPLHNRYRTEAEIITKLSELANVQPAWLAYRKVVRTIEKEIGRGQPGVPSCVKIPSVEVATNLIESSSWIATLDRRTSEWTTPGKIAAEILSAYTEFDTLQKAESWMDDFSGKEIFRPIRDFLYTPKSGNVTDHDADFAAEIGSWQAANDRVPPDIHDLLLSLRSRVGIHP